MERMSCRFFPRVWAQVGAGHWVSLGAFLVVVLGTQAGRGLGRLGKLGDALLTEGTTSSRGRRECPLGALLC